MAHSALFIVLSMLFISSNTHVQSTEEGFISLEISSKGLDFVKDLLIEQALSSLTALRLPQIEKTVKNPVLGQVHMVLSNITIYQIGVSSSIVKPGDTGIAIVASGATASLSMDWRYSCSSWLIPIAISDNGVASVQVEGMEVGLTLGLKNQQGTLKLSLMECGFYVKDILIKLDGGASWLYQGLVDAFEGKIGSAVEDAVSKKISDGIVKLDSLLQSLPKEVTVDNIAALNVSFVDDIVFSNSSVELEIDGRLFSAKDELVVSNYHHKKLRSSVSCKGPDKMVGISLHENVLNSASSVYFNADLMHWILDQVPHQSLLNTARWRFVVPKLYKLYPNDNMNLNISISSPPIIKIEIQNIDATIFLDVTVDVLDADEVIPIACFSLVISASASAKISRNTLVGSVKLVHFTMFLKWSRVGKLHMHIIKKLMSTALKRFIIPSVNSQLMKGFPLPDFHGYTLQDAQIICNDSWITICSDVMLVNNQILNANML